MKDSLKQVKLCKSPTFSLILLSKNHPLQVSAHQEEAPEGQTAEPQEQEANPKIDLPPKVLLKSQPFQVIKTFEDRTLA